MFSASDRALAPAPAGADGMLPGTRTGGAGGRVVSGVATRAAVADEWRGRSNSPGLRSVPGSEGRRVDCGTDLRDVPDLSGCDRSTGHFDSRGQRFSFS